MNECTPLLRWTMVVWVGECLAFSIPAAAWGMLESGRCARAGDLLLAWP
ncbi:MAG: hypothetical protein R3B97_05900 [Dehalococcoidia bacterium]